MNSRLWRFLSTRVLSIALAEGVLFVGYLALLPGVIALGAGLLATSTFLALFVVIYTERHPDKPLLSSKPRRHGMRVFSAIGNWSSAAIGLAITIVSGVWGQFSLMGFGLIFFAGSITSLALDSLGWRAELLERTATADRSVV